MVAFMGRTVYVPSPLRHGAKNRLVVSKPTVRVSLCYLVRTLNSDRCTWLVSLVLAVFVVVSGQVRALDAWDIGPDTNEDDVTSSVLDDGFVALPRIVSFNLDPAPAGSLLPLSVFPAGRLVVPDLFRPPIPPAV
jgi:hypothetical protein